MSIFFNSQGDYENMISEQFLLSALRNSALRDVRESYFSSVDRYTCEKVLYPDAEFLLAALHEEEVYE